MQHEGTTLEKSKLVSDPENGEVIRRTTRGYEPSDFDRSMARMDRFTAVANWIVGAITALLAGRFLLNLLGANPEAGFTRFIHAVTQPLVAPFTAIFGSPVVGEAMLDSATLVALVVYPLVGYGLIKLARAAMAPTAPRGVVHNV